MEVTVVLTKVVCEIVDLVLTRKDLKPSFPVHTLLSSPLLLLGLTEGGSRKCISLLCQVCCLSLLPTTPLVLLSCQQHTGFLYL